MLQQESRCQVADNTGAQEVQSQEFRHFLQVQQAGVGDLSPVEAQVFKLGQFLQVP